MNMVIFTIKFLKVGFKVFADIRKYSPQIFQYLFCEHSAPVFGDKDQMDMKHENAVSSGSYRVDIFHRPTIFEA